MLIRDYIIVIAVLMNNIISLSSYQYLKTFKYPNRYLKQFHYPVSILPGNMRKLYSSLNNNDNNFINDDKLNLFEELKSWRKKISDEIQKPIFLVFPNKVVEEIVIKRPKSLEELSLVKGLGPVKLKKYGRTILDMVVKHISDEGIDLETIKEKNIKEDTSFWDAYKKNLKPKIKKVKKVDEQTASIQRKKRIEILSESASKELKWPEIEYMDLNEDQQKAANHILEGNNVFLTGSAGTGKTFLLRYVIQELTKKYGEESIAITAPTGIAAVNIGGQTIHSFAGIGLAKENNKSLIAKVVKSKSHVTRWENTKVLIIDEISMLHKDLFEVLDDIARVIHENDQPFGGIQLIVVGDFMQLPPVCIDKKLEFCFQSHVWDAAALNIKNGTIYLSKIERQKDDVFIQILNQIRLGRVSKELMASLDQCLITNKPLPTNGIIPTKLYSINKEVNEENAMRLQELPGEVVSMTSEEKWKRKPTSSKLLPLFRNALDLMIPKQVDLKVGAQVMLLRNRVKLNFGTSSIGNSYGPSLVNGSRGKVIAFTESVLRPGLIIPTVQFDNGITTSIGPVEYTYRNPSGDGELVRFQIPLKLAWAATIHKSQGCTLTCAELMLENTFDYGQAYVALSRVKSLEGLWLSKQIKPSAIKANPKVLEFYGYV